MDCSPTDRERELGLDRRETGWFYPTFQEIARNTHAKCNRARSLELLRQRMLGSACQSYCLLFLKKKVVRLDEEGFLFKSLAFGIITVYSLRGCEGISQVS